MSNISAVHKCLNCGGPVLRRRSSVAKYCSYECKEAVSTKNRKARKQAKKVRQEVKPC